MPERNRPGRRRPPYGGRRRSRGAAVALGLALALLATACGSSDGSDFAGRRLDNPWPAADVALTDTDGASYSLATDTRENAVTLLFFGYTHCPDLCPLVMNNVAAAMNRLSDEDRERVGMVFVTTDPARDDEAALRRYLDSYDPSFVGLTGDLDTIIEVGKPVKVYVSDGQQLPTGGYDLGGHTTSVLGLQDGEATVVWNEETTAPEYADDIHTLLDDRTQGD
ncbi:SCO family protein [Nocardioides sp. GY 10113]|uniref:SCO family protein n=1 Tax=Nocardioides sp. GY 10113 TaxID=2569761 RepID=UPI0010A918A8|nr:SCO family protein [Nocardioides sp. GY 10113]TIC88599.1 SCO family protein [Nocardioides sp. GY 10113]